MAELENNILAVVEPAIMPTKIEIDSVKEEGGDAPKQSKSFGTMVPFILVNNYQFRPVDVVSFKLDLSGILPSCTISLYDTNAKFAVTEYPRDGDYFTILINSKNQETFKSVHMDFDIISVTSSDSGGKSVLNLVGMSKIPKWMSEDCKNLDSDTSLNHIELLARELELGLATNIDATDDAQPRIMPYTTYSDFIKTIVSDSYVGEDSFQKYFIDQYYYFNYIDINKIFNSPSPPISEWADSLASFASSISTDTNTEHPEGDDAKVPLLLTNHVNLQGMNLFVEKQEIINNSMSVSLSSGYKRTVMIYDNNSEGAERKQEFTIEALSSENLRDSEEPMKGNRNETRYEDEVKFKYLGRQNAGEDGLGNTHANAAFSKLHNIQNKLEIEKMKLKVTLNSFNPSFYKFQKIPVLLYHYDKKKIMQALQQKVKAEEAGLTDTPFDLTDGELDNEGLPQQAVDSFLSGYYIIENIVYEFDAESNNTKQVMTLLRREWPTRMDALINPPEGGEFEPESGETVIENDPAPEPPPEPTPTPEPEPTPTPTPTPEPEELEITININGDGSTFMQDDTNLYAISENKYFECTGTWTQNRDFEGFEAAEIEFEGVMEGDYGEFAYPYITPKKDGTWKFETPQTVYDEDLYIVNVRFKAEGKWFNATKAEINMGLV